jgi:hypothetical protein
MELEALCKKLREDAQKLREEKAKLKGVVKSRNELIMEITNEIGLNHMGEDAEDKEDEEDEDDDDKGDVTASPAVPPSPVLVPPAATHEVIITEEEDPMEMVPEQQAHVAREAILVDAGPTPQHPHLYTLLMRDYLESRSRMMDDPHELDDLTEANYDVDEWYPEDGSND